MLAASAIPNCRTGSIGNGDAKVAQFIRESHSFSELGDWGCGSFFARAEYLDAATL